MDPSETRLSSQNPSPKDTTSATNIPEGSRDKPHVGDKVQDAKEQMQHKAKEMVEKARHQTTETVENKKHVVADQVGGLASILHNTADQLGEQQQESLARYAHSFAGSLDHMAGVIRDKDIGTLFGHVQDFARRQPALFIGGAVVAGFLLARFLKSSDKRNHPDSGHSANYPPQSGTYSSYQEKGGRYES